LVTTEYFLISNPDITGIDELSINNFLKAARQLKNKFSTLGPRFINANPKSLKQSIDNNTITEMKFISGACMFFNKNNFDNLNGFDENIFLYFEETDLYFRCHKANLGIYLIDEAQFKHFGSSAINTKYKNEITINRNWHFCWSKFYYYKKNYGYFYGLKKTVPNLLRAIKKYLTLSLKGEKKEALKHKAEIGGLITSYLLKKSYLRPNIKL
jgi:GT2 family glycosyltransferase